MLLVYILTNNVIVTAIYFILLENLPARLRTISLYIQVVAQKMCTVAMFVIEDAQIAFHT